MPVQSRANSALAHETHDPYLAAAISFGSGLAILACAALLFPRTRAGVASVIPAVRRRRIPWYLTLAGLVGAYFVVCQSTAVPVTGIALFTVGVVAGQSVSGLLVDHLGLGPAGKKHVTLARVVGVVLMLAAVAVTMAGKGSGGSADPLWLLLPLSAGFLTSFQQAANGRCASVYGSPIAAAFVNFFCGFLALGALWLVRNGGSAMPELPDEAWMYAGGLSGCIYIAVNAWLIRHLGVLGTAMGMIAGQLLGSLGLDLVFPVQGSSVTVWTFAGLALTFAALAVMNLPAEKRRRV